MFSVVFIPDCFLQAVLRHEPELHSRPAALTDPELPKLGVVQFNSRARAAGVCEGISASQALARCPDLLIKSRCPAQERAATDVLIQTAYAFSPFIEATGPGICAMDLRGLRIVSDESAMTAWGEEIRAALAQFHLDSRIRFAPTPDLALLAAISPARENGQSIFIMRDPVEFLADLPIQRLGLSGEALETLNRWGIKTAGALLKLGKDPLVERLGSEVIAVFERLAPHRIRPLKIAALPEIFSEQMEFQTEVETLEPLLFVLRRFTEQLARRIQMFYLVVAELHLKLGLSSGAAYESVFKVPSPTGNAETLFRMLHTRLENLRTDAAISSLCLMAKPGQPDTHQFGLFESTLRNPNQFAETLARLEALCGADRVGTPVLESTLRPDAFKLKSADFGGKQKKAVAPVKCGLSLRRFRPPLGAQVEFRERSPALIRSAVCNGRIVERRGPFLTSGNWWDEGCWWREEWDVQMADGAMYRIFRADNCFVEGVYD